MVGLWLLFRVSGLVDVSESVDRLRLIWFCLYFQIERLVLGLTEGGSSYHSRCLAASPCDPAHKDREATVRFHFPFAEYFVFSGVLG